MLPARATRPREPPLEFVERNRARARDPQEFHEWRLLSVRIGRVHGAVSGEPEARSELAGSKRVLLGAAGALQAPECDPETRRRLRASASKRFVFDAVRLVRIATKPLAAVLLVVGEVAFEPHDL